MTRFEFVSKLNSRLYLLNETERLDIIDEYMGHIDLKMQEGKSESDAIKDFGDVDELAREILRAYHIDSSKVGEKTLDIYIKQIFDYFSKVSEKILGFSARQLAQIFVEFVVLLVILNILRLPVGFCADMFAQLFSWLPYTVYHIISRLVGLAANLFCLLFGFMFIYHFINRRIINGDIIRPKTEKTTEEKAKNFDGEKIKAATAQKLQDTAEKLKEKSESTGRTIAGAAGKTGRGFARAVGKTGEIVKKLAGSTGDFVINLAIIIIRITLFVCVWAPRALITIAGIVCTVLATIIYSTTGIGFMGICIAGLGCCIIGCAFTLWLTQVLTGGKTENENG